jgi:hypothetical protein
VTTVLIYVEPATAEARRLAWTRCLLHADQCGYTVLGIGEGKSARLSVQAMLADGSVDLVVTAGGTALDAQPKVEVAGAGRCRLTTYTRAARLRRIAVLVDSGLSDEEVLRQLRGDGRG